MTPKRRSSKNRDLPENLYATSTGFEYKHPITKVRHGVGSDRALAIRRAKILNQKLMPGDHVVDAILGEESVEKVIGRFRKEYLVDKKYSDRSASEVEYRLKRYEREFGDRAWGAFDLKFLSDWLSTLTRAAYIKHRGQWVEIFKFTCSVGLSSTNIAELTLVKEADERKRKRWTTEAYAATYAAAEEWLQDAMQFAVTSLQRRDDLVSVRKKEDFEGGRLKVMQKKTGKRIAIKISGSLEEALDRAKKRYPFCPFVIGHKPERHRESKAKTHPYQVLPDYLTKAVAAARDASGAFDGWPDEEKPTLHELRSYGAHLYREAGFSEEYIQALLGHADTKMTQHYLDGHKIEWQEVDAELKL